MSINWTSVLRRIERAIPLFAVALMMVVAKQQTTIDDLRWKIATAANGKEGSLELQVKCAKQAKTAFDEQGFYGARSRGAEED